MAQKRGVHTPWCLTNTLCVGLIYIYTHFFRGEGNYNWQQASRVMYPGVQTGRRRSTPRYGASVSDPS